MIKDMQGECSECGRSSSNLTSVKKVDGSFYGAMKVSKEVLCENCTGTEFFYLDNNNTVKYNSVKVKRESTIKKE